MGTARAATAIAATIATSIPAAAVPFSRRQNSRTNKGGDHRNRYNGTTVAESTTTIHYNEFNERLKYLRQARDASSCGHGRIFTCRRPWLLQGFKIICHRCQHEILDKNACHSQHGATKVQGNMGETWGTFCKRPPAVCNEQQQATVSVVVLDVDLISLVWCFFYKHCF